jgi:hypothetical protein
METSRLGIGRLMLIIRTMHHAPYLDVIYYSMVRYLPKEEMPRCARYAYITITVTVTVSLALDLISGSRSRSCNSAIRRFSLA